jgi:hypothetical protein
MVSCVVMSIVPTSLASLRPACTLGTTVVTFCSSRSRVVGSDALSQRDTSRGLRRWDSILCRGDDQDPGWWQCCRRVDWRYRSACGIVGMVACGRECSGGGGVCGNGTAGHGRKARASLRDRAARRASGGFDREGDAGGMVYAVRVLWRSVGIVRVNGYRPKHRALFVFAPWGSRPKDRAGTSSAASSPRHRRRVIPMRSCARESVVSIRDGDRACERDLGTTRRRAQAIGRT